jgi:thiamine biosynthesis protein ThiS
MNIIVNGDAREFPQGTCVTALFNSLGLNPKTVVVQRNDDIVERATFDSTLLSDGDRIELIRFVGGG